jgi:S-(hydroxymethyl)glutathione dehydrogenase/alcohol dehydrogenase
MEGSMVKAAVMWGFNEPLKIDSLKLKAPREDEVVVKVAASGVCHSDLSVVKMVLPIPPPIVLGHEGAGIVEEIGKGVKDLKPGDHVVLSWVENCGKCHYCISGRDHLCDTGIRSSMAGQEAVFEKDGVDIARMAGVASFAERTVVRATACVKIPEEAPLDRACLVGCGVMTGVGAATNTAKVRPGETVAVFGCGGVGLNVIQGAALCGASRIIAVDLVDAKLQLARVFGATDLVNGKQADPVDAIKTLTDGLGVDYAFEVIGAPSAIQQAFGAIKRGGKAVVVGVPQMGAEVSVQGWSFPLEEKAIIGSLYGSANMHRDMPRLIELYMQKRLKIDELISRRIRLDDVNAAFEAMEAGEVARSVIVY